MASKGLVGGVVGQAKETLFGGNTDEEDANAEAAAAAALAEWDKVKLPDLKPIDFERYEWQGDYAAPSSVVAPTIQAGDDVEYNDVDTRFADTALMDGTAFDDIESDPRLRDSQLGSLSALDEIISGGGMTARERADLERVKSDAAAGDRGRRGAILQDADARGMGGSGMELLAQLQSSQAATDRAAQSGLEIQAQAQDRALQALMSKGAMAGDIRGQDYGEASKAAAARDAIANFNAGSTNTSNLANMGAANSMALANAGNRLNTDMANRNTNIGVQTANANNAIDTSKTNAGYANNAALYNHQGKQTTSNANKDVANKQTVYNQATLPQQQFDNSATVAGGKSGAYGQNQQYWQGQSDREAAEADQMFGAAIQGGAAILSDERTKTDKHSVNDTEITDFLDSIQGKRFRYKEPGKSGRAPGERLGIMAQDLEKSSLGGEIVKDTPDGKALDRDNLLGAIVASLGHLAKKGK